MLRYRPLPGMHWLHAVDLGKWKVGVASALVENPPGGEASGRIYFAETVQLVGLRRGAWTADAMGARVDEYLDTFASGIPEVLVYEWPKKYDLKRVVHNDLDDLHAVGDAIAHLRQRRPAKKWRPGTWKGGAPKDVHWRRNHRALTLVELGSIDGWLQSRGRLPGWLQTEESHDTRDAISLALYALGRVQRGGLAP